MADHSGYTLAHPVYLDVPMMVSFLAALEGGVAPVGDETITERGEKQRAMAAKVGVRAKLWGFGEGDASADASSQTLDESSLVSQTQRHHTAASLFNILYGYLRDDGQILDVSLDGSFEEVSAGQLVEFKADYVGNPLEDVLGFFEAFLPYILPEDRTASGADKAAGNRRSGNPARRAAAELDSPILDAEGIDRTGLRLLQMMAEDVKNSPVHDLLFGPSGDDGSRAVVMVNSDFYSNATVENLRAGQFRVVGKVTRVLSGDESINLTRRSVLGLAGPDIAKDLLASFNQGDDFSLSVTDPIVHGPALQILPMSIFV